MCLPSIELSESSIGRFQLFPSVLAGLLRCSKQLENAADGFARAEATKVAPFNFKKGLKRRLDVQSSLARTFRHTR